MCQSLLHPDSKFEKSSKSGVFVGQQLEINLKHSLSKIFN